MVGFTEVRTNKFEEGKRIRFKDVEKGMNLDVELKNDPQIRHGVVIEVKKNQFTFGPVEIPLVIRKNDVKSITYLGRSSALPN